MKKYITYNKIKDKLLILCTIFGVYFIGNYLSTPIYAFESSPECTTYNFVPNNIEITDQYGNSSLVEPKKLSKPSLYIQVEFKSLFPNKKHKIDFICAAEPLPIGCGSVSATSDANGHVLGVRQTLASGNAENPIDIKITVEHQTDTLCIYRVNPSDWVQGTPTPIPTGFYSASCSITSFIPANNIDINTPISMNVNIYNLLNFTRYKIDNNSNVEINHSNGTLFRTIPFSDWGANSNVTYNGNQTIQIQLGKSYPNGNYIAKTNFFLLTKGLYTAVSCISNFNVPNGLPTPTFTITPTPPVPSVCLSIPPTPYIICNMPQCRPYYSFCPTNTPIPSINPTEMLLCTQLVTDPNARAKCEECRLSGGMYTAIGCLPTDPGSFVNKYLFTFGLGMAGVIGFILMLFGSFTIMTSQGDPQKITKGKEVIVSVLAGLILIIFSLMIIKIIGIDIFNIPGLGG